MAEKDNMLMTVYIDDVEAAETELFTSLGNDNDDDNNQTKSKNVFALAWCECRAEVSDSTLAGREARGLCAPVKSL